MSGNISEHSLSVPGLGREIPFAIWTHDRVQPGEPAPLLYVHDGSDFVRQAELTRFISRCVTRGTLPPMRAALVDPAPGERNNWYAASDDYTRAVVLSLIPRIRELAPTSDRIAGLAASYGAIALLMCAHEYPGTFGSLLLHSTSCFLPELDQGCDTSQAEPEYSRIATFVRAFRQSGKTSAPMIVRITCGDEPLARSFADLYAHIAHQGHNVTGARVAGGHNYESWGKAFDPHLSDLLNEAWDDRAAA